MSRSRILLYLSAAGVLLVHSHQPVQAASATANLSVGATIVNNCTISTTPVGFPAYDPVETHATNPDDSTAGSVTITCTRGTAPTIGLGLGQNRAGSQMRMTDGTNYLNYALYKDAAHASVWGDSGSHLYSPGPAPSKAPRTYAVYGRIPGGQDLPAGNYSDTVVATVNF
jgi:spore coat protein U-like protein